MPHAFNTSVYCCLSLSASAPKEKKGNPFAFAEESEDSDRRHSGTAPDDHACVRALRSVRSARFCHVQGDFASDDNPKKETARMMLGMAREINAKFPDGKRHVSCYTCHRGMDGASH